MCSRGLLVLFVSAEYLKIWLGKFILAKMYKVTSEVLDQAQYRQ